MLLRELLTFFFPGSSVTLLATRKGIETGKGPLQGLLLKKAVQERGGGCDEIAHSSN